MIKEIEMTNDQANVNKVFGDPFDTEPDERIRRSTGGYTKIEDGQTVRMRFTMNIYRFYKFTPEGATMPLQNQQARELLDERTIDELFEDQTIKISEGYAAIVWNFDTGIAEVWQFSRTVFEQLKTLNRDTDWEGGLAENDIKVTRNGKGTDTKYSISYAKKSEEIDADMQNELLNVPIERMIAGATRL